MKNIKKHLGILEYLRDLPKKNQINIIKNADKKLLHCLSEICLNLVRRQIPLKPNEIKNLKKYEKEIRILAERKHSLVKRKKVLIKGGFFPSLLGLLPTLISGIIASLS